MGVGYSLCRDIRSCRRRCRCRCCFLSQFPCDAAKKVLGKVAKKRICLSEASLCASHFAEYFFGRRSLRLQAQTVPQADSNAVRIPCSTPKGSVAGVAFLWFLSLAKQRKGLAAGPHPACLYEVATEVCESCSNRAQIIRCKKSEHPTPQPGAPIPTFPLQGGRS
jgi:hypothetical protein